MVFEILENRGSKVEDFSTSSFFPIGRVWTRKKIVKFYDILCAIYA